MANHGFPLSYLLAFILILSPSFLCRGTDEERKVYIVYMGSLPDGEYSPLSHHRSILQEVTGDSAVEKFLVRSYQRSFNGFAANLTSRQSQELSNMNRVVSVFPSMTLQLQTTRRALRMKVLVQVPKKWKGVCRGGQNFTCNRKIIGARYYTSGPKHNSARDDVGHGTHTASIASGINVKGVSFYGMAQGTARGGVPSARIAAYKVCTADGCNSANVLAAFDDAIADGVDIITISVGLDYPVVFFKDTLAIGAFHAMAKGILTSNSASNDGPSRGSVSSVAPWLLTVAASSIDRQIIDKVVLGNNKTLMGNAVNSFTLNRSKFPLAYGKDISGKCSEREARVCDLGCIDSSRVKGKIVLCDVGDAYPEVYSAGATGSILKSDVDINVSEVVPFPSSALSPHDYDMVISYVNATPNPQAVILKSEIIKDADAPVVVSFSSRGPNAIAPDILKPDLSGPGLEILAAYSPVASPSDSFDDKRRVKYNVMSGTSMSCPHAAGVAAYVKTFHPDWSPSAIKSALMTTAGAMDAKKNSDAEFAYGSGHINPVKAVSPGLVYEAFKGDYIKMLCSMGYNEVNLKIISGDNSSCPKGFGKASVKDLNYPSMAAEVSSAKPFTVQFNRIVTNVGHANSIYKAQVVTRSEGSIKVVPEVLSFKSLKEKQSFVVIVTGKSLPAKSMFSASLVWSDGTHTVRSPIVIYTN
ncbi:Subtilisin-like protease [Quillaja saponaria]|uniref:Subtilisin-like protease n=1 Tax=Quillaja saponaria TaxID=32244 RepID=A0AAD7VM97_QUISA|nr:Subtilisin-like protease [Quillaja saponaria]